MGESDEPEESPRLQFSLLRLALALCAFGIPFALFGSRGAAGIVLASLVGGALALLMLVVKPKHQEEIFTVLVGAAIGAAIYTLLIPPVVSTTIHPYDEIPRLQRLLTGAGFGCLLGLTWNWIRRAN